MARLIKFAGEDCVAVGCTWFDREILQRTYDALYAECWCGHDGGWHTDLHPHPCLYHTLKEDGDLDETCQCTEWRVRLHIPAEQRKQELTAILAVTE